MERPSYLKRRGDFKPQGDPKKAKTDEAPKKMSFAERMMAKQGWKAGEGLGKEKSGIVDPISVQLRPSGVGLGSVKEKTKQQKTEEKRQADRNGEQYDDSSEEERQSRKRRKEIKKKAGISSGTSTPGPGRSKQKFTIDDIPEGMHIPQSLISITDATGKEPKLLTSATLSLGASVPAETTATKIAKRARLDLEAYASAFNDLAEEKNTTEFQEEALARELATIEREIKTAQHLADATSSLRKLQTWDEVIAKLEELQMFDRLADSSVAIAAIHPLFRNIMSNWDPLSNSLDNVVADLQRLSTIISPPKDAKREDFEKLRPQSTTQYETMIQKYFLPKMRSALIGWDPLQESMSLIAVLAAWFPILPKFVQNGLLKQVATKLSTAIQAWNPRKSIKKKSTSELPNLVTPWLQFLPRQHSDPQSASGLVSDVKRKFRTLVEAWDLSRGLIPETEKWRRLLGKEFDWVLVSHLLPKLAHSLKVDFEVNPADQDIQPLLSVLQWKPLFKVDVMGELIAHHVMPKFLETLHLWLTSEPNYKEIEQWLQWLKLEVMPEDINNVPAVSKQWQEMFMLVGTALDLGDRVKTDLPLPRASGEAPESPRPSKPVVKEPPSARKEVEEATFRDVVEAWCADENLLLIPLRKAHDITGNPLFRITASAVGQGGVVVYFKGDVLYAQNKKDKTIWEPTGLEKGLVQRAEGK